MTFHCLQKVLGAAAHSTLLHFSLALHVSLLEEAIHGTKMPSGRLAATAHTSVVNTLRWQTVLIQCPAQRFQIFF